MKIQAKDLWRLMYNAQLFTDKKSATGGVAKFRQVIGPSAGLAVFATDDHVAICDKAPGENTEFGEFFLSLETMKQLEKSLREIVGEMNLVIEDGEFRYIGMDGAVPFADSGDPDLWNMVGQMLSGFDFEYTPLGGDPLTVFALNPDRLRKFSLLKPGDYPIDIKTGYDRVLERDLVAFKAGPTLRGVLAPLDRKLLTEKYGEDAGSVMW